MTYRKRIRSKIPEDLSYSEAREMESEAVLDMFLAGNALEKARRDYNHAELRRSLLLNRMGNAAREDEAKVHKPAVDIVRSIYRASPHCLSAECLISSCICGCYCWSCCD